MKDKPADSINIEINFPIKISLAVFFLSALFNTVFYLITRSPEETLIFSAATTAAAGTILAAFYSARVLSLQLSQEARVRSEYLESLHLKRLENAMAFGARWTDPNMQQSRKTCRDIANMKEHSLEEVKAALDTEEKKADVFHLLNFFEEIATAIKYEMADSETLKEMYSEAVHAVWESLNLWIEDYKKSHNLEKSWILIEKLHMDWKS